MQNSSLRIRAITVFIMSAIAVITASQLVHSALSNTAATNQKPAMNDLRVIRQAGRINRSGMKPLDISALKVNGKPVKFDEAFSADKNFPKTLSFEVRNVSERPINLIVFGLHLYGNANAKIPSQVFSFNYGDGKAMARQETDVLLNDGETIFVSVPTARWQSLEKEIAEIAPNLSRIDLSVEAVFFADKTAWRHGYLLQPDPQNSLRWVVPKKDLAAYFDSKPRFQKAALQLCSFCCCAIFTGIYGIICDEAPGGGDCVTPNDEWVPRSQGYYLSKWEICTRFGVECWRNPIYGDRVTSEGCSAFPPLPECQE